MSPPAAQLLHRLAVDTGNTSTEDVLARIAQLSADRAMNSLRRTAATVGDPGLRRQYSESVAWLKSQSEQLADHHTRTDVLATLIPWLIEHGTQTERPATGALAAAQTDTG